MGKRTKRIVSQMLAVCMAVSIILSNVRPEETQAEENLMEGLIGHWTFDGGSDTEAFANSVTDSPYTGQAKAVGPGVVRTEAGGISGGSLYFSKQSDSYFKLPQIINAAEPFTIAAWVRYDAGSFSANNSNINLFQQNGSGRTILFLNSERKYKTYLTGEDDIAATPEVEIEKWTHIAVTSDPASGLFQFFVNGNLVQTNTLNKNNYPGGITDLYIGAHKTPVAETAMKGCVDELRFYNRAADAETIKAIYDELGAELAVKERKENLSALIREAEELTGGTEEAAAALYAAVTRAKALLNSENAKADELDERIEELSAEIKAYKKSNISPIEIKVDTSSVRREISDAMFGINHRYHNDGYSSWNARQQEIEPEFDALAKEASFGSVRYPGGTIANLFDWKHAIDHSPAGGRMTIHGNPADLSPITPNFGVDEAMTWIYDELDAEAVWVYGMAQGSASDAADLFEYLNAPADGDATNPNGGTDWAEIRKENGHEEPYHVTRFEIGNEMGLWGQNYWMDGRGSRSFENVYVNGGDMAFTKQRVVQEGDWRNSAAVSDGSGGQVRYARYKYVKEGSAHVYVDDVEWQIVESLDGQGEQNVCELDCETGKICFGDGINGNIPENGTVITVTYTSEQDGFIDYYEAIKNIAAQLGMEAEVYSCMETEAAIAELEKEGKYDGAVIHPYSETSAVGNGTEHAYIKINDDDPEFYEKLLGRSLQHNITRVQDLVDRMGEGKVPVVSEFGIYNHNTKFTRSIGHAVYLANEMISYIDMGTPYLNKHCLVDYPFGADNLGSGSQCVIQAHKQSDGSVRFVSTPSAQMFSILNNMTGNQRVSEEIKGNETYYTYELYQRTYEVPMVKVLSSKDEEGNTYITVVNNHKDDETAVKLSVDERDLTYHEITVWYLTSEYADDENTLEEPNLVKVQKESVTGAGEYLDYVLAPHSITSFKIPAEKTASVAVRAEMGGSVSSSRTEAVIGSSVTVTAEPEEGYLFAGWYNRDGQKVSEEKAYTFTLLQDSIFTAVFIKKEIPITNPDQSQTPRLPAVGKTVSDPATNGTYQVIASGAGTAAVAYTGAVAKNKTAYTIPGTVKVDGIICKVTAISANAFKNNKKITSVKIGANVGTIGAKAFFGCSGLKRISIGSGVTEIGAKAFCQCSSLNSVTIPAKVKKIGKQAFGSDKKLKKIIIKTKKLTKQSVGKNAFKGIYAKVKITVPSGKRNVYRKLLKERGISSKATVK